MPRLLSVNVGLPREIAWQGKVVRTAIWKQAVPHRVVARRLNLDGDGQADLEGHGGEHRAVMVYQIEAYRYWERELSRMTLNTANLARILRSKFPTMKFALGPNTKSELQSLR